MVPKTLQADCFTWNSNVLLNKKLLVFFPKEYPISPRLNGGSFKSNTLDSAKNSAELCMISKTLSSHHPGDQFWPVFVNRFKWFIYTTKLFLNDVSVFLITLYFRFYGIAGPGETQTLQLLNWNSVQKSEMPKTLPFFAPGWCQSWESCRKSKNWQKSQICKLPSSMSKKKSVLHCWVQEESQVTFVFTANMFSVGTSSVLLLQDFP